MREETRTEKVRQQGSFISFTVTVKTNNGHVTVNKNTSKEEEEKQQQPTQQISEFFLTLNAID